MNAECVVSDLLLWKGEKWSLLLADQRKFCLGIIGCRPCIDCASPKMASIDPNKPLSLKLKATASELADCESNEEPSLRKSMIDSCLMLLTKRLKVLWRESAHRTLSKISGIARPGPNRAYALPSAAQ